MLLVIVHFKRILFCDILINKVTAELAVALHGPPHPDDRCEQDHGAIREQEEHRNSLYGDSADIAVLLVNVQSDVHEAATRQVVDLAHDNALLIVYQRNCLEDQREQLGEDAERESATGAMIVIGQPANGKQSRKDDQEVLDA